jgi:hypothetical protein
VEIQEPPTTRMCSEDGVPIRWLYSAARGRWVAFSPHETDPRALYAHEHAPTPQAGWRELPAGNADPERVQSLKADAIRWIEANKRARERREAESVTR